MPDKLSNEFEKRAKALKSKTFKNIASRKTILKLLRPIYPDKPDSFLWSVWQTQMDVLVNLVCLGYGVGIAGQHFTAGVLHPDTRKGKTMVNIRNTGELIDMDPKVMIKFKHYPDFLKTMNAVYYSDLKEIVPELFGDD